MAENRDGQEKSEDPSARRLMEARLRGQVSKSMDVTTAAVLIGGGLAVFLLGGPLINNYKSFMGYMFHNIGNIQITQQNISTLYVDFLTFMAGLVLPISLTIFVIALIAEISQVGFHVATKKFTEGLRFKQIFNPFSGIKKIFFSGRSFFELFKSLMKLAIIGTTVFLVLNGKAEEISGLLQRPFTDIGSFMANLSFELIMKVGAVYIVIAASDYFYQKYKFKEEMKMTKQEVREENKQSEGDPKVKARMRSIMRNRIRRLMLQNVKKADVVITNPTHFAVALQYDSENMNAPRVVAKGLDYLALQIRTIADEAGVPIVEEPPLARALYHNCEIDQEVPEELFKAVAQVLAYIYSLRNSRFNKN